MNNEFVYLAFGSNLGNRKENFEIAIKKLEENKVKFIKSSPIYKTPALLLQNSPDEWNKPFLNCIIKVKTELTPFDLLSLCQKIELELGRDFSKSWAPRPIDLDILFYKNEEINTEKLTIPHKAVFERYFLLDELSFLYPEILEGKNYYLEEHLPCIMGILNITPDSFSNDGLLNNNKKVIETIELWENESVPIIDIGGESTKPNAEKISKETELDRLAFVFDYIKNREKKYFSSMFSIDTYKYETAKKAIENGFNIINDVNGIKDERMIDILQDNQEVLYVLTHSLSVPPNKEVTIKNIDEVEKFLEEKIKLFENKNINKNRVIFDFGIGFGKTPEMSLKLLQNIERFHKYGLKILVGHSRKSFMKMFNNEIKTPDYESLAISLKLKNKVDIFRVHTPIEHQNAILAYNQLNNQYV